MVGICFRENGTSAYAASGDYAFSWRGLVWAAIEQQTKRNRNQTMNNKQLVILLVVVGVIGTLVFFLFRRNPEKLALSTKALMKENESVPPSRGLDASAFLGFSHPFVAGAAAIAPHAPGIITATAGAVRPITKPFGSFLKDSARMAPDLAIGISTLPIAIAEKTISTSVKGAKNVFKALNPF